MNKKLDARLKRTTQKFKPLFFRDGNFTVAVLVGPRNSIKAVGASKRNPNEDPDIPERGRTIALARAVKKVAK